MDELLAHAPKAVHDRFEAIVALTDSFCDLHLNVEYKEYCRLMAAELCRKGSPVATGKPIGWASGIIHALGWVNFLFDKSQIPHMEASELAEKMGIPQATMAAKSKVIRDRLDLTPFHPDWTLPSGLAENPLVWMVQLKSGVVVDIRHAPQELQEEALRLGLIPFLPPERPEP